jgi:hypothetical protein
LVLSHENNRSLITVQLSSVAAKKKDVPAAVPAKKIVWSGLSMRIALLTLMPVCAGKTACR